MRIRIRIRSRRRSIKQTLQCEPLEERIAMTSGLAHPPLAAVAPALVPIKVDGPVSSHVHVLAHELRAGAKATVLHAGARAAAKANPPIKGTLSGGESSLLTLGGSDTVIMGGSSGKIGNVDFQASMFGTVSGNRFQGGMLHLSNSQGDIPASLGPGTLVKHGKTEDLKLVIIFGQATGPYAQASGWAGDVTFKLKPSKAAANSVPLGEGAVQWAGVWIQLLLFIDSYKSYFEAEQIFRLTNGGAGGHH
jgi:hypothetical protein